MDFNSLIFPIPTPTYTKNDYKGKLLWIPKKDFSYKDKIKYSNNYYYQINDPGHIQPIQLKRKENPGKLILHSKSASMVQKVPSITFQIDNKFNEDSTNQKIEYDYIPCLYIKPKKPNDKIILYFHSNYEDAGNCFVFCNSMCQFLGINILIIEFPGYGIYKSKESVNADLIMKDADIIFSFINEVLGISESNIIIMGRSVGSGPATYLATKHNILSLILLSPFKSIKEAIKTMFPKLNFGSLLKTFVKERFNNYENISKVSCPILFIHGKDDNLIPSSHSIEMINQCKSPAKLVSPQKMSHNSFDFVNDVYIHIRDFLKVFTVLNSTQKIDDTDENINDNNTIDFPQFMFFPPID